MVAAWGSWILLVVGSTFPAQDPAELVRKLGSGVFAEREEAAKALDTLGRDALPALEEAREADDPEVRARAAVLAAAIQERVLIEPTMVTLDFENRPILEVARALSERSGMSVLLVPENQAQWQTMRVTMKSDSPVPFWAAMDRLCEQTKTQLQASPGMGMGPGGGTPLNPAVRILQGQLPPFPTSDQGPFRSTLVSLHHHRDLTFQRSPGQSRPGARDSGFQINDQFYFSVQVSAEPRLLVNQTGPMRVTEATDDRGRSLVSADGAAAPGRGGGYIGMGTPMTALQLTGHLMAPGEGSSRLALLRGSIPVSVATPRPSPLTIELAGATGKTFRSEEASITVESLHVGAADMPRTIDLSIEPNKTTPEEEDPFELTGPRAQFALQVRFQLLNAQGRPLRLIPSRSQSNDGRRVQLQLTIPQGGDQSEPKELRFHDLTRATTEVEFEYRDVPIP